jgi:hypothetical protein
MQTEFPFYEGPEDALRTAIQALGGAKKVASEMWPDKTADNASRLLLDCINPSRAEKLEISQIMRIFKQAKEAGCHGPFAWFAHEIGYEARPVVREEEVDRLVTVIEQASKTQAAALAALERLQRVSTVRAA